MAKRNWIYTNNVFLNQTSGSQRKALILFEDTFSKLSAGAQTDRNLAHILSTFQSSYLAYQELNAQKTKAQNFYEGHTARFEEKLETLNLNIRKWEAAVRSIFVEDSPDERMIFPNKRSPFFTGSYESRLSAIKTLFLSLSDFPTLGQLKSEVELFYTEVAATRQRQQEYEGLNDQLSTDLERQRQSACWALYGVLGQLMSHFQNTPDRITDFFDLSLLRTNNATGGVAIVKGQIKNTDGQTVATAIVRLLEGGFETVTDDDGYFAMEVESGTYTLEVRAAGYLTYTAPNFSLEKDKEKDVDIEISKTV